ncbi:MAG: PDZ domain-containing protein [Chloroflexi bacterium]|nr:PDZ domain-containing protein [Chloroflexota bacterium]
MTVAADTVTVYTTNTCPWCVRAKEFLKQKNVPFQEKNIERDPVAAREIMQRTGQMGVPVITAGSEVIVGFDRPRLEQLATRYAAPAEDAPPPPPAPKIGLRVKDGSGGALVDAVRPGLPAEAAGVRVGDLVTEINGRPVRSGADLENALAQLQAGQSVAFDLRRDGRRTRLRMSL